MSRLPAAALGLALCLLLPPAASAEWGPWEAPVKPARDDPKQLSVLRYGVRFFQKYISPVDGPRCPMAPTCSAYALQALDKHGPVIGTMMTVDRLFHESDPREHRHPVNSGGRIRFYDPLENNDFWFDAEHR
ncbi:MAG: membrane protein insertion efficiency factor YidD [Desulfuromonadales bacterium]|nr:membrane protein insertion efficiency factor YidD [Desulfuromonadales bacterium]NIS41945.1 membrane protein insertion efficiency factor YidD [Desulfuromonadales bacterium]